MRCLKLTSLFKDSLRNIFIYTKVYKMLIPKSIKFQKNLTEAEIRAYYSLKPLDEDYEVHQKRFDKVLNEYLQGREFKNANTKACYKSQLKRLIKEGKTKSPKYDSFNMWRFSRIQFYISKAKDYELQQRENSPNVIVSPRAEKDNDLIYENQQLKEEIENLKKQLIEKDNQIELLKNKPVEEVVEVEEVEEVIYSQVFITSDDEEEEVIFSEDEDDEDDEEGIEVCKVYVEKEVKEEKPKPMKKEDEVRPIEKVQKLEEILDKNMCIEVYYKTCKKEADTYHQEYMKSKQGKTDKEIRKITNDIKVKFFEEVVEINLNKLDDIFDLPFDEYEELQKKAEEELKHKILYFSD